MSVRASRELARLALVAGVLYGVLLGCASDDGAGPAAARDQGEGSGSGVAAAPAVPAAAPPVVVPRGDGALVVVPATAPPPTDGRVRRYLVEVEGGLGIEPASFAAAVEATLGDPRSWGAGGRPPLHRVDSGAVGFRLVLASPALTDELCAPLRTAGRYSCFQDGRAVVNSMRWLTGAPAYAGRLDDYRDYVVNHEVGHALGSGHTGCPGRGRPAPVMMQQTKGVGACTPSAWPFP